MTSTLKRYLIDVAQLQGGAQCSSLDGVARVAKCPACLAGELTLLVVVVLLFCLHLTDKETFNQEQNE